MIKYSIIIPVYNRTFELECCLTCLFKQGFDFNKFEVIVCDDGSQDDILSVVQKFANPDFNIKYFWQPDKGFRAGQARNRGVELMDENSDAIIFVDSDIIVRDNWLATYHNLHNQFPNCVICGRYDFLLPMKLTLGDILLRFDLVISNRINVQYIPKGELIGADIRQSLFERDRKYRDNLSERPVSGSGGALFGGNVLIPKKIFLEVGGFDENIVGHGGEDSDLGQTIDELGYKFIFTDEVMGWHIWHERNQEANIESLKKNIKYIDSKHKRRH